jgi:hypothetical protein
MDQSMDQKIKRMKNKKQKEMGGAFLTLKMRFVSLEYRSSPPRKWTVHTNTMTTERRPRRCAANAKGRAGTLRNGMAAEDQEMSYSG